MEVETEKYLLAHALCSDHWSLPIAEWEAKWGLTLYSHPAFLFRLPRIGFLYTYRFVITFITSVTSSNVDGKKLDHINLLPLLMACSLLNIPIKWILFKAEQYCIWAPQTDITIKFIFSNQSKLPRSIHVSIWGKERSLYSFISMLSLEWVYGWQPQPGLPLSHNWWESRLRLLLIHSFQG